VGEVTLAYLDEVGFSPSQPTSYSWTPRGQRTRVPYENPQGRRVNALAAFIPDGPERSLWWDAVPRTLRSEDLLLVLDGIPRGTGDLIVVLDNASMHRSRVVQEAVPALAERGIHLYYLPPYSPELNAIEPLFGVLKYTDMPERTYATIPALLDAINRGFVRSEARLLQRMPQQLRPAA
jgi:putative transposase